jgi:hypothetical protein
VCAGVTPAVGNEHPIPEHDNANPAAVAGVHTSSTDSMTVAGALRPRSLVRIVVSCRVLMRSESSITPASMVWPLFFTSSTVTNRSRGSTLPWLKEG